MIVCPNCNHQNPEGATQCEACYTPLPVTISCPNCGAPVQSDATFCGQCGFNLQVQMTPPPVESEPIPATVVSAANQPDLSESEVAEVETPVTTPTVAVASSAAVPEQSAAAEVEATITPPVTPVTPVIPPPVTPVASTSARTQLQIQTASLLHVQTNTKLELPQNLSVIHLGKPNETIPPDIDVSGFPDAEIVSRIHADIRVEGDAYYVEDVGSSNGTYINHTPLPPGNRHKLRAGDRLALGKGDKMTFIFQIG